VPDDSAADPYRLPRTVVPSRYDLTLRPDLDAATFTGTVRIEVSVRAPTATVLLNAADLVIDEAAVVTGDTRHAARTELDEATERLHLHLDEPLTEGDAVVELAFTGVLNDQLKGFYRSTFTDDGGHERVLATTQFEATDARRAFPCWDEPDLKAGFAVTLEVPDDLLAVSNAREVARQPLDDGRVRIHFAETMVMSTYLVAFVVGPLEVTDPVPAGGVDLRVVHPVGKGDLAHYALEVGAFCLDHLAGWYDLAYPGDKLDLVAIPDFAFGAMENLGCVTFREVLLLVDPSTATQPELQNVVDVIAHELAHMWFGDLVTMRWWNGIWLNEAFATFMEMATTDAFRPDWERWTGFGVSRSEALDTDALHSTRPIEFEVTSPEDAEAMFDVLTYEKGAAVVRMLEQYLGEDRFREGIRRYLGAHQHANTETTDLWDAIEEATGAPTRRIMDSWIFQGGYPLVGAAVDGDRLVLTQERFTYLPDADPAQWAVPVLVAWGTDSGETGSQRVLLDGARAEIDLREPVDWVLVNRGGSGFYRVLYPPELRAALADRALDVLEPIERYQFLDDLAAAALAGRLRATDLLEVVLRFEGETDLSVWQRLVGSLHGLRRLVDGDAKAELTRRTATLLAPAYDRLGPLPVDGESDRDAELRALLFGALGTLAEDTGARARAADLHRAYLKSRSSVDPALAAAAAGILADVGEAADYDAFLERFGAAADPQVEQRYLYLLADFEDPDLFARTLALTLTDQVRSQNAPYVIRRGLTNRERGADAWTWITEHWDEANARFPSNSIARMLGGVRALDDAGLADEVEAWLDEHPVPQGDKQVRQARERLRVNVAYRAREAESLKVHLAGPTGTG
jgi:puromycin-sensitive aminopeptidase